MPISNFIMLFVSSIPLDLKTFFIASIVARLPKSTKVPDRSNIIASIILLFFVKRIYNSNYLNEKP